MASESIKIDKKKTYIQTNKNPTTLFNYHIIRDFIFASSFHKLNQYVILEII